MALPRTALLLSSADPNDPVASDSWTDFARSRMIRVRNAVRGRQYEVGYSVAGRFDGDLLNIDEYLNPANTSSPFLATAKLMRRVRWMAVHPADGAGNLVNMANMKADPSFESYAAGPGPAWLWYFGTNPPTVTATGPHTGTRAAVHNVLAGNGLQGIAVEMRFVPGDVYVVSMWINQSQANTAILAINGHLSTPMATTSATGYVKLVGAFVADQPTLQVCVVNQTPTLTGTITYDEIQVEQATPLNANPYFEHPLNTSSWLPVNGATAVASNGQAFQGSQSLLVTPNGVTAVPQAQSEEMAVTGSTPYVVYGQLRSASSGTRRMSVFWYDSAHTFLSANELSQALSPGVWTQYGPTTYTSPATAAYARLATNDPGTPPSSNSWRLDSAILVSPSAFTTAGPRVRGLWGGHVERLPVTWDPTGYTGTAKLTAVGPLAALAQIGVKTDYAAALASQQPDYCWPLWDGSNAVTFAEISGNGGPPLIRVDGASGPAVFSPGTQTNIPGDPSGTGLTCTGSTATPAGSSIVRGGSQIGIGARRLGFPAPAATDYTVALWLSRSLNTTDYGTAVRLDNSTGAGFFTFSATPNPNQLVVTYKHPGGSSGSKLFATDVWGDSKPHLYVMTVSVANATGTARLYVDSVQADQFASAFTASPWSAGYIEVGGGIDVNGVPLVEVKDGVYAYVALWNRALTQQDVTDLWTAGRGYPGETTGARLSRLLGRYYVGPTVIDTGRTKLNPSGVTAGTKLGQAAQRIVESEYGDLKETRDAALQFDGRDARFLATAAQAVFGENVAGGEIPYRDAPVFGYDTGQLNNQAIVTQAGGTKAIATDPASIKSYYQRDIEVQTDTQSGLEAIDYATWLTTIRAQPKQRMERITLDPGANPALWPTVLDLELGQRYTVKRNAKAGNNGAGLVMAGDYFLENVTHRDVDFEKGSWLVDLILSPAPLQPWILGDPTYGALGISTVLGF